MSNYIIKSKCVLFLSLTSIFHISVHIIYNYFLHPAVLTFVIYDAPVVDWDGVGATTECPVAPNATLQT